MSHVLVWSRKENVLRVEAVERMLSRNRAAYRDDSGCDYLPIAMGDMPTLLMAAQAAQKTLMNREKDEPCPKQ